MRSSRFECAAGAALFALAAYGILTLWVEGRWALAIFQVGVFGLAAACVVNLMRGRTPAGCPAALFPLAATLLWGAAQLATGQTVYRWQTWNAVLNRSVDCVAFFLAAQLFAGREARERFLNAALYGGFFLSVFSTAQMFTSDGKIFWLFPSGYPDYILGPFVYRNQYAALMELMVPVALWRALREPARAFRYAGMAAVMGASVVAAASRAGTVLIAAEVAAALALGAARGIAPRRAVGILLAQFGGLALAASAVVGWDVLGQRFCGPDPYHVRHEMLLSSLDMVRERPWTGFGMGTWATVYPGYARFDDGLLANQAHNDWAQWAVEGGIPLAIMMLAFGLLLAPRAVRSLWGLGVAAVLLHCTVDYPLQQRPALSACFFAMAGALAAAGSRRAACPRTTYYEELGVRAAASAEEIRTAHKALLWLLDPARHNGPDARQEAKRTIERVNSMAATLLDPEARRAYDAGLADQRGAAGRRARGPYRTSRPG